MYSVALGFIGILTGCIYCRLKDEKNEQKFSYIVMPSRKSLIIGACAFVGFVAGTGIDIYRIIHQ